MLVGVLPGLQASDRAPAMTFSAERVGTKVVISGGTAPPSTVSDVALVPRVLTDHVLLWLAHASTTHAFLHAGVVVRRGGALLIVGESGAGKSTLVDALLARGATYLSDEFAAIDAAGAVAAVRRPLSNDIDRGHDCDGPIGVDQVMIISFDLDTQDLEVQRLQPGRGVLELLPHCTSDDRGLALEVLGQLAGRTPVFLGTRGEAGRVAEILLR